MPHREPMASRGIGELQYLRLEFSTRLSILCVTHQMSRKKRDYSVGLTVPYKMMNYKWYLMVLGQYMTILAGTWSVKLVPLGIRWYRVTKGLVCLYILEKSGDLVGCYRSLTYRQQNIELLSLSTV